MKKILLFGIPVICITSATLIFIFQESIFAKKLEPPKFELRPIKNVKLPKSYSSTEVVIPSQDNVYTEEDYKRKVAYPFLKRWLGYSASLKKHPLYDAACLGIAKMLEKKDHNKCAEYAIMMLKKDQYDPIALFTLYHTRKNHFTKDQWKEKALHCSKSPTLRYKVLRYYMYEIAYHNGDDDYYMPGWLRLAMFKLAGENKLNISDSQFVYRKIVEYKVYNGDWMIKYSKRIHPENKWLKHAMLARSYRRKAWDLRGSGMANTVSENGWKGFDFYLKKAAYHYQEAWKINKEIPAGCYIMIEVAHSLDGVNKSILWFNRSVAAQADRMAAYVHFAWRLRPRWGGSPEALVYLADECFKSKLFQTKVPEYGIKLYVVAGNESQDWSWQKYFQKKGVAENIDLVLKKWERRNKIHSDNGWEERISPEYFKARSAIFNFYAGNLSKANKIIKELGNDNFLKLERQIMNNCDCVQFIKVSEWNKYFNSHLGFQLSFAHNSYLQRQNDKAIKLVEDLLKLKTLTQDERAFIANLWGIYNLDLPIENYMYFRTSFTVACLKNRFDIASKILQFGFNINRKNNNGLTPLHVAAKKKANMEALKFLMANGANVNALTNNNKSPLYYLICNRDDDKKLKYLLQKGASSNLKLKWGFTMLMKATACKKLSHVKLLVDAGADINAINKNNNNISVLGHAKKYGSKEIVNFLASKGAK